MGRELVWWWVAGSSPSTVNRLSGVDVDGRAQEVGRGGLHWRRFGTTQVRHVCIDTGKEMYYMTNQDSARIPSVPATHV